MRRSLLIKLAVLIFSLIVLISLFSPGSTATRVVDVSASTAVTASPDWAGLRQTAEDEGAVRVIVQLAVPFQPEGYLRAPDAVESQRSTIRSSQAELLQSLQAFDIRSVKQFRFIPAMAFQVDAAGLDYLVASPLVAFIEEDVAVPPTLDISIPLINADDAWSAGFTGAGQTVAILDTGVDSSHSFFGGRVVDEACYSTTSPIYGSATVCPNGQETQIGAPAGTNCPLGIYGCDHGTHVAGIAAGEGASFNGVAPEANIIAIQVFSQFTGADCGSAPSPCVMSLSSDQTLALERVYALRNTYDISSVNMSLGGGGFTDPCDGDVRKPIIDNLLSVGIATVISSGNSGYTNAIGAPGCISTAVTVGATTTEDIPEQVDWYSNSAYFLDLLAPGSDIYSSIPGGGFSSMSGTSMAAPHVTGAWAVLKSQNPSASVAEILTQLQDNGVEILDPGNNMIFPRIDVFVALTTVSAPGDFTKTTPVDSTNNLSASPTLGWQASSGATSYEYCLDTSDNDTCEDTWENNGTATSASLSGLMDSTTYYWQVRALNNEGSTEANSDTWWEFTTISAPTCYALVLEYTGSGSVPTASPTSSTGCAVGEFVESEVITLTAQPDPGWYLDYWDGTDDPDSNLLTIPAGTHKVTAHYLEEVEYWIYIPFTGKDYP